MKEDTRFIQGDTTALKVEYLKLKSLTYDVLTELPTVPIILDQAKKFLESQLSLGIFCFDFSENLELEKIYGWSLYDKFLSYVSRLLKETVATCLNGNHALAVNGPRDSLFYVVFGQHREYIRTEMAYLDENFKKILAAELPKLLSRLGIEKNLQVSIGYTFVEGESQIRDERLIYYALKEACEMANNMAKRSRDQQVQGLRSLIERREIRTLYQPIVCISPYEALGYELLCLGPEGTGYERPTLLFDLAEKLGLTLELEKICKEQGLERARHLPEKTLLFINVDAASLEDPDFKLWLTSEALPLPPDRLVLEITERTAITNFKKYREGIHTYRQKGIQIAVDDVGSGYSSLQHLAELHPDYIKVDMSLVRDIDRNLIKQSLLETLLNFSNKIGSRLIAEGVETREEFLALKQLGLKYLQGLYFAGKGEPFPPLNPIEN